MPIDSFSVKSNIRDYQVFFAADDKFLDDLTAIPNAIFVIDANVWRCHRDRLSVFETIRTLVVEANEENKSLDGLKPIYDEIMKSAAKKNMTIVSIGGGIIQDLTGFVASTLYRGINWFFVPTTMLAQCDSCIGAKTSLNYHGFKNLIGTFYPPHQIFIYTQFLKTQQDYDYFSGIGELVKLHLIGGEITTDKLLVEIPKMLLKDNETLLASIHRSLLIKKSYIENDEFDRGRRSMLNFGHCFGHALEKASNFSISHGQAVILGMILANKVSVQRGLMSQPKEQSLVKNAFKPFLKVAVNDLRLNPSAIILAMKNDKKRTGDDLALVMMSNDHTMMMVNDLKEKEALMVLEELNEIE